MQISNAEGEKRETLIKLLNDHQNEGDFSLTSKANDGNEKKIKKKKY